MLNTKQQEYVDHAKKMFGKTTLTVAELKKANSKFGCKYAPQWLIKNKTNKLVAQKYVTSLYSALAELALLNSLKPLKNLVNEQTPGGLNWQGVNELKKLGYYRLLEKSLKKIYKRL